MEYNLKLEKELMDNGFTYLAVVKDEPNEEPSNKTRHLTLKPTKSKKEALELTDGNEEKIYEIGVDDNKMDDDQWGKRFYVESLAELRAGDKWVS